MNVRTGAAWKLCDLHGNQRRGGGDGGAVAQIMQWALVQQNDPVMSNAAIKKYAHPRCKALGGTGVPNREWGYGALDVYQAFEYLRL